MRAEVKLHYVTEASFSKSEATRFKELPVEIRSRLRGNGAVAFISKTGNQIEFVYGAENIDGRTAIMSAKCRLDRGAWNPLMLQDYAERVGLHLENLRRFKEFYSHPNE